MAKPRLVIVSEKTRRHFQQPLKFFKRLEVFHLYRDNYPDFDPNPFGDHLIRYQSIPELIDQLDRLRPKIIQGLEPYYGYSRWGLPWRVLPILEGVYRYARFKRIPYFFHVLENLPAEQKYGRWLGRLMLDRLRSLGQGARFIFALNQGGRANLNTAGLDASRIKTGLWGIWGVDLDEFRPTEKTVSPSLVFAGRLSEEKGILDLLASLPKVVRAVPNLKVGLIGDGPLKPVVQKTDRWPIEIELVGSLAHDQMAQALARAWLVVTPSKATRIWAEQVGMVNIEAMATGTPVVTSASGSIPEFVPSAAGAFVPEGSPDQLAQAIIKILADDAYRIKLSQVARQVALNHYDARRNVERLEGMVLDELGA